MCASWRASPQYPADAIVDGASQPEWRRRVIIATTENIAGHRVVTTLGQVFGVVVRSRGIGGNIMAGLRSIGGGETHEYTQLLEEARRHPADRRRRNATAKGAHQRAMSGVDSAQIGQP